MYRQSIAMQEKQASIDSDQFLVQVSTLPVVHSAVGQLLGMYARTKDYNRLVKFTCETAELGMSAAVSTAKPVLTRLPVDRLNSVACNQLDNLTKSYPVLVKPTDEVLADTYRLYETTLKPTVDRVTLVKDTGVNGVSAVGQFGVDKVNGVTKYTKDTVVGAKNFGLDRIQSVKDNSVKTLAYLLATTYGQVLSSRVDTLVDVTDGYVEKYLPATEDEALNQKSASDTDSSPDTLHRVGRLSGKFGRRMLTRANNQVTSYRQWTADTLTHIVIPLDLVNLAKSNLDAARSLALSQAASLGEGTRQVWEEMQKPGGSEVVRKQLLEKMNAAEARLWYILTEINRSEIAPSSDCDKGIEISKFERQLIATARHLTLNLKSYLANVSAHASSLSTAGQERIKEAGSITNFVANIFATTFLALKDIPRIAMDNTHLRLLPLNDLVTGITEATIVTISTHPKFAWLTPAWILSNLKASDKPNIDESSAEKLPKASEKQILNDIPAEEVSTE